MKPYVRHITLWFVWALLAASMFIWARIAVNRFERFANRTFEIRIQPSKPKFIVEKEILDILKNHMPDKGENPRTKIKEAEAALEANPFVENAEVYFGPDGILHARIEQIIPIAKLVYRDGYGYLDRHGKRIPASKHAEVNLPQIELSRHQNPSTYFVLAKAVYEDETLRNKVRKIKPSLDGIHLKLYGFYPDILLGDTSNVKAGLYKLKLIQAALKRNGKAHFYKQIDLHYKGQAICKKN